MSRYELMYVINVHSNIFRLSKSHTHILQYFVNLTIELNHADKMLWRRSIREIRTNPLATEATQFHSTTFSFLRLDCAVSLKVLNGHNNKFCMWFSRNLYKMTTYARWRIFTLDMQKSLCFSGLFFTNGLCETGES